MCDSNSFSQFCTAVIRPRFAQTGANYCRTGDNWAQPSNKLRSDRRLFAGSFGSRQLQWWLPPGNAPRALRKRRISQFAVTGITFTPEINAELEWSRSRARTGSNRIGLSRKVHSIITWVLSRSRRSAIAKVNLWISETRLKLYWRNFVASTLRHLPDSVDSQKWESNTRAFRTLQYVNITRDAKLYTLYQRSCNF